MHQNRGGVPSSILGKRQAETKGEPSGLPKKTSSLANKIII